MALDVFGVILFLQAINVLLEEVSFAWGGCLVLYLLINFRWVNFLNYLLFHFDWLLQFMCLNLISYFNCYPNLSLLFNYFHSSKVLIYLYTLLYLNYWLNIFIFLFYKVHSHQSPFIYNYLFIFLYHKVLIAARSQFIRLSLYWELN